MEFPKLEELNCSNCTERSIEAHYPDFWEHITKNYHCEKWTEKLYWFYHNINDYPRCRVCGKPTKFINLKTGYREFCSTKCMNSCDSIQERKAQTSIKRYGVRNAMQNDEVKKKLQSTLVERYGVDNISKSNIFHESRKRTCLEKYGVEHPMQSSPIREKMITTQRLKNIYLDPNLIGYTEDGQQIRKCCKSNCDRCTKKYYITPTNIYFDRNRLGYEPCTTLVPVGNSQKSSLEYKVKDLLDRYGIHYICNDRKLMSNGKELDIFIPDYNLAIECNGIWSHSIMNNSSPKPKNYHIDKTRQCRAYGIELIHLWEDWIMGKWDIVESMLLNKLNLTHTKLYARNTRISEINVKECKEFIDKNHIQGAPNGSHIRIGLYDGNELVSVMTFTLHQDGWHLDRFCNKLNTNVVGGASKLLKYFINQYSPDVIISFSSNDISCGDLYKTLGFETDYKYQSSYWYFRPGTLKRDHRASWSKPEIVRKGIKNEIDDSWTEFEVMKELGFFCIYDSGQYKWILDISKEKDLL